MFERDQNLQIERYTRKLGNQFVSSILRGNGAVVLEGAPSAELSFICLLADDKRAVFFDWLPRANVPALTQCTRDGALRDKPRPCLELLLQVADRRPDAGLRAAFPGGARARPGRRQRERRDQLPQGQRRVAPVPRRRVRAPARSSRQGVAPDDHRLACMVELTRRRALDMR